MSLISESFSPDLRLAGYTTGLFGLFLGFPRDGAIPNLPAPTAAWAATTFDILNQAIVLIGWLQPDGWEDSWPGGPGPSRAYAVTYSWWPPLVLRYDRARRCVELLGQRFNDGDVGQWPLALVVLRRWADEDIDPDLHAALIDAQTRAGTPERDHERRAFELLLRVAADTLRVAPLTDEDIERLNPLADDAAYDLHDAIEGVGRYHATPPDIDPI